MITIRLRIIIRLIGLLLTCVVIAGCFGKQSPRVTYYSLLTMEQLGATDAAQSEPDLRIGIGPITIPDVLRRTQIVTRDAQNIYRFDEFHRWAGVLEKDFAYVLGNNLGDLLGVEQIAFFPWMHHFSPTHRVIIDVVQFDGDLTGEAILSARWAIVDKEGKVSLAGGKSDYKQPVKGGDYAGLVKAESLLLAELSKEIAKATAAQLP
ncbi:MAG: membrane integrity-associated transporter subunit PqiC [Desulfuromonadales bacterium]|nr:membrane integrity-associated transporter subunit PqiC [Desulfuromonadales bacterium]